MRVHERDPQFLIAGGLLEKVLRLRLERAPRAGQPPGLSHYRAVRGALPRPYLRDAGRSVSRRDPAAGDAGYDSFAAGVEAIVEAQQRVAQNYFYDGSVEAACPPLKALLHIMAHREWEGKGVDSPEVRAMFTREALLASGWYQERLHVKQERDVAVWRRQSRRWRGGAQTPDRPSSMSRRA